MNLLKHHHIFLQHHWKTGAILRHKEIPGRAEDPQPDSISASPAQAVISQCRPHHTITELLHQAEGQLEAGRVHKGENDSSFSPGISNYTPTLMCSCSVFEQSSESEVHFDVEIAIKVLRQAGYHSHAVFLAEKHMHHEWYLKIQLEDLKVINV